jgi:hypothetical protein
VTLANPLKTSALMRLGDRISARMSSDAPGPAADADEPVMTPAVKELVHRFEALPEAERQEVLAELLRRARSEPHDLPTDEDLTAAARLFQDLDKHEQGR